ncbi:MAG TPA: type II toxin-antitoxin system HicB family antitoxin [Meiothermus sp.]|jgi:predicted RNase H-like HicB family nuclease|nr:type II toxin-antitoxin system HicB family antitoxin [Meiothermus sp.]
MGLLTDYLASALKSAQYRPGEGGYLEATIPEISGLLVRGRSFEECRERLREELELWLAKSLLSHQTVPELGPAGAALQELALTTHPSTNPTEQVILKTVKSILEEVRTLRRGGRSDGAYRGEDRTPPQLQPPRQEPKRSSTRVSEYVNEVGLQLQLSRNGGSEAEEKALERISGFMGERFSAVSGFYEKIKVTAAKGSGEFQYSLASASQNDIGAVTQLCTMLKEAGLLKSYTYSSKQRRIYGRLSVEGKMQGFITGGWLERYAKQVIQLSLRRRNIPHDLLANPCIVYPNADRFEVDLLVRTQSRFLLVECKTGGYDEALERHQRIAQDLRIPAKQVMYVLLGIPEPVLDELHNQWGFTFVSEKTLEVELEKLLT